MVHRRGRPRERRSRNPHGSDEANEHVSRYGDGKARVDERGDFQRAGKKGGQMKWTDLRDTFEKVGLPILAQAIPGGGIVAPLVKGALSLAQYPVPSERKAVMMP